MSMVHLDAAGPAGTHQMFSPNTQGTRDLLDRDVDGC